MGTRHRLLAAALLLALVAAGCGDDPALEGTAEGGDGGEGDAAGADDAPAVEVVAPSDGAEVEPPFDIEFEVSGVEIGPPETGKRHVHVYVGGDYETHYTVEPFTVTEAAEGEQAFRVVLARANHDELDVGDEVTLTVAGGAAAAPEDEDEDDDGYGY